jgi:hypothetical protein
MQLQAQLVSGLRPINRIIPALILLHWKPVNSAIMQTQGRRSSVLIGQECCPPSRPNGQQSHSAPLAAQIS